MSDRAGIVELGHVGLFVTDMEVMRSFYEDVMGLTVSDVNPVTGAAFLSSRPEHEHHELVLAPGRDPEAAAQLLQQLSWRVDGISSLQRIHQRLLASGAEIVGVVTHGNAIGIYFLDPERNTTEVYVQTGLPVPQPFREPISLEGTAEDILAESERLVRARLPELP
jgi:catechol-2,3-dioxygenase